MAAFMSLKTQYENLGDEVINSILLQEIAKRTQVNALSADVPQWYLQNVRDNIGLAGANVRYFDDQRAFTTALLCAGVRPPKSWVFTACGDVSGEQSDYKRDLSFTLLQYLPWLRLASVGASYSSVSPSKARLLRLASQRSKGISVRDSLSQSLLAEKQVKVDRVPDLAFKMPWRSTGFEPVRALFSFRQIAGRNEATFTALLKKAVEELNEVGLPSAMTWQVGRDEEYCRCLAEKIGIPIKAPPDPHARVKAMCQVYDGAALVFSNRLHVLLVAASRGAVPIALLHKSERKIRGIFYDNNMSDYYDEPENFAFEKLKAIIRNLPQYSSKVRSVFDKNSREIDDYFDRTLGSTL